MVLVLVVFLGQVTAETPEWKAILRFQSPYIGIAGFLSETFGIVPGDHHHGIEITSDGTQNWTQKLLTRANLWGIDFLDERTFFCCGNQKVLVTEDGGATWSFLAEIGDYEPDGCKFISFVDRQTGWIAAPQLLAETRDGGKTWMELVLPDGLKEIVAADRLDASQGFLMDAGGTMFVTRDAGKTWTRMKMPWKGENPPFSTAPVAALRFNDALHGTALMWRKMPQLELTAMRTDDGGRTWKVEKVPVKYGGIFLAPDGKTLTVSGVNGETSVWRYQ